MNIFYPYIKNKIQIKSDKVNSNQKVKIRLLARIGVLLFILVFLSHLHYLPFWQWSFLGMGWVLDPKGLHLTLILRVWVHLFLDSMNSGRIWVHDLRIRLMDPFTFFDKK